jgi:hypothetical protein
MIPWWPLFTIVKPLYPMKIMKHRQQ